MRILYSDYRLSPSADQFAEAIRCQLPDCEVECWQYTDDQTLLKKLEGTVGLLTANLRVSECVLKNANDLKVISVDATGYGNINIEAAKKYGIVVCSIGAYCTEEVADHSVMLALMLEKKMKQHMYHVQTERVFDYKLCEPPHRLRGKNFVIFGYGRIGQSVAERAQAFGYRVYAVSHDVSKSGTSDGNVQFITKEEACEIADVMANHMSENPETFEYFNREMFKTLKKSPLFLNLGRGSAVNETDLLEALENGWVSGAGLDVLKEVYPDLKENPFVDMDNVIITPHMAFYSEEAVACIRELPVKNLVNGVLGKLDRISHLAC